MENNTKEIRAIDNLDDMTGIIKNELENIACGFISVGYYLKKTRDDELYKQNGYGSIFDYAKDVFGIGRSTATRFMQINDKYSIGGYSPEIEKKWNGYGSSKLTEMLGLPEDIREAVPEEATVKDIREVKATIKETESHYEDQMELCDMEERQNDADWLEQLAKHLFREDKEAFRKMVDWSRADIGSDRKEIEEDILAIVNPTKFKMIRLETANVLLQESAIRVMPYRGQGENQEHTYIDLAEAYEKLFFPDYPEGITAPVNEIYKKVYGEPIYPEIEKAQEAAGKKEPKKEKKHADVRESSGKNETVVSNEPGGAKSEAERTAETKEAEGTQGKTSESEESAVEQEPVSDQEGQVPGQTEITRDFPQYCPDSMEKEEKNEAKMKEQEKPEHLGNTSVAGAFTIRKLYLASLPDEEAGEYMAEVMTKKIKELKNVSFQILTKSEFWESLLTTEVDKEGREIECVN